MRLQQVSARVLLCCFFGLPFCLFSQSAPPAGKPASAPPVDPKKAATIEEIFRLTKPEAMTQQMLDQYKMAFRQAAGQGFVQEIRKFDDPAKYQGDFNRFEERVFAVLSQRLNWAKMKPQFVQTYADTFTADELSGMVAFYRSPAGQAYISKTPSLLTKFNAIGQQQMAGVGPEIQKMSNDFMADIKKRSESSHPNPPPAKK